MNKNIIYGIIGLVVIGGAAYAYFARPVAAPSETVSTGTQFAAGSETYRVASEKSQAKFTIDEILRGKPFTVVGTTNQITGEIAVKDSVITFGTFTINARTLKTDNEQRNGAIARLILKSEQPENEFITFVPSAPIVIPENTGSEATVQVAGNLTISGVTRPQLFDVTLVVTDDAITGTAKTTIKRSDYNLVIPNIPFVAGVPDEFTIAADVVAEKVQ